MLDIVYRDDYMVVVNKPAGILVHRSPIARDTNVFVLQLLRDQIGKYVYPVHRLDRKTSGLLIFALDVDTQKLLNKQFENRVPRKSYRAIVRGYINESVTIDYALKNDKGKVQEAITIVNPLLSIEAKFGDHRYPTSRYSFVELIPKTGRMHQLRKHMAHICHPIIGDRPHGCNKQNRLWKQNFNMTNMLLHAREINIQHPIDKTNLHIEASFPKHFLDVFQLLGIKP